MTDILLAASPAVPKGLNITRSRIQVPQRFRRVDEKSSTQFLPMENTAGRISLKIERSSHSSSVSTSPMAAWLEERMPARLLQRCLVMNREP